MSWTEPSWTFPGNAALRLAFPLFAPLIADQPARLADEAVMVGELVARRQMLGLSQAEAAARIGVDQAHLARWEGMRWRPQPPCLVAWAQALGLRLALVEGEAPRGVDPARRSEGRGVENRRRPSRPEDGAQDFPASAGEV